MADKFDGFFPDDESEHEARVLRELKRIRAVDDAKQRRIEELSGPPVNRFIGDVLEIVNDEFEDFDFVIPDVFARGERFVITGYEGSAGKTTFARQICVTLAAGIHPFTFSPMEPKRCAYVDLENGRRTEGHAFKDLIGRTGKSINAGQLMMSIMDSGIDLANKKSVDVLLSFIDHAKCDFFFMGPIYKMCLSEDRRYDPHAQAIQVVLDRIRMEFDCAVMVEQHSPMTTDENKSRVKRPYGSQLWSGWPEFGKWLGSEDGGESYLLEGWRGDRMGGRQWPSKLRRGDASKNEWPWIPVASEAVAALSDAKTQLLDFINGEEYKITATQRQLAGYLGINQSTVLRQLKDPVIASAWATNQCKPKRPSIAI